METPYSSLFYHYCICEAEENGLISKSYRNPLYIGFAANYDSEPFLSIKKKLSLGELSEGELGYPKDIELSILKALVDQKRISKVSSLRLIALFDSKRTEISLSKKQKKSEMDERIKSLEEKKITKEIGKSLRPKGQCRVCGSLDTKRSSQILEEGTSSTVGFGVGSSGSLAVGVGFSKTAQAKKAQDLRNKGLAESYDGYNKLTRERSIVALISPAFIIILGPLILASVLGVETTKLGISGSFILFLYFAISAVVYFSLPFVFSRYGDKELYEKSYVFGYSADYWSCLRCGHSWDENR